jgi:hypothetical protein
MIDAWVEQAASSLRVLMDISGPDHAVAFVERLKEDDLARKALVA